MTKTHDTKPELTADVLSFGIVVAAFLAGAALMLAGALRVEDFVSWLFPVAGP
jgi:hypothetical protein